MNLATVYHLDPIDAALKDEPEFDVEKEWRDLIEEARWDQKRLRELRQQGGSLEEVIEIMQRARAGLEELMERDPAHAEEIAAFLDASAQRIRQMVLEHNRAVLKQRALARN